MADVLRRVRADNPGPFTFDGTVTHILGHDTVLVVDPGPDVDDHIRTLVRLVAGARSVGVLLTHGHEDHAGGVDRFLAHLARHRSGAVPVYGAGHPTARLPEPDRPLEFDDGRLLTVPTPGHTSDHLAFYWPEGGAVFAGDHLLGYGDTTWVAEYPGCVADYLESLARLRALDPAVIYSAHGPPLTDPVAALDRFESHRRSRIEQVRRLQQAAPGLSGDALYLGIYGDSVPAGLEDAARASLAAVEEYVAGRPEERVDTAPP